MTNLKVIQQDAMVFAAQYQGEKFSALLTDAPYEMNMMGRDWDNSGIAFDPAFWSAICAHLYPGAIGISFASSRGWHRLAGALEDAGMEIVTVLGWAYGTGWPKAQRIDTQIDAKSGAERPVIGCSARGAGPWHAKMARQPGDTGIGIMDGSGREFDITAPVTPMAQVWEPYRYGRQALKPAVEPLVVFRRPAKGASPYDSVAERLRDVDPVLYVAKPTRKEKDAGLKRPNLHPTVKPIRLSKRLSALLRPDLRAPHRLLVPFSGTGSEMIGAMLAGWGEVFGVEKDRRSADDARSRAVWWCKIASQLHTKRVDRVLEYAAPVCGLTRNPKAKLSELPLFAMAAAG